MFRRSFLILSLSFVLTSPLLADDGPKPVKPPKPAGGEGDREGERPPKVRKEGGEEGGKGARIAGKVKAVNLADGTITLEGRRKEGGQVGADQTFEVVGDASIKVNGAAAGLKNVPVGSEALLQLDANKQVIAITVGAGKEGGREGGGEGNRPPKRGGEGERKREGERG